MKRKYQTPARGVADRLATDAGETERVRKRDEVFTCSAIAPQAGEGDAEAECGKLTCWKVWRWPAYVANVHNPGGRFGRMEREHLSDFATAQWKRMKAHNAKASVERRTEQNEA